MISIFDVISVLKNVLGFIKWLKYRKLIEAIKQLNDDEKHILRGLSGSPTPLQIYQAIKQSTGSQLNPRQLFNDEYENTMIEKQLIVQKNGGYMLSEGAEYAISKGALNK